jgi:hypothetical protein
MHVVRRDKEGPIPGTKARSRIAQCAFAGARLGNARLIAQWRLKDRNSDAFVGQPLLAETERKVGASFA